MNVVLFYRLFYRKINEVKFMSNNKVYLTEKGLQEIKDELEFLKLEKRPEVINS